MAGELEVDLDALRSIARSMTEGASALDALADGAPVSVDAGDMTEIVAVALGHLLENAGNLVMRMQVSGQSVSQARDAYGNTDAASARAYGDG